MRAHNDRTHLWNNYRWHRCGAHWVEATILATLSRSHSHRKWPFSAALLATFAILICCALKIHSGRHSTHFSTLHISIFVVLIVFGNKRKKWTPANQTAILVQACFLKPFFNICSFEYFVSIVRSKMSYSSLGSDEVTKNGCFAAARVFDSNLHAIKAQFFRLLLGMWPFCAVFVIKKQRRVSTAKISNFSNWSVHSLQ